MNMIQSAKDQVLALTTAAYQKAAAAGLLPEGVTVTPSVEIPKDTAAVQSSPCIRQEALGNIQ